MSGWFQNLRRRLGNIFSRDNKERLKVQEGLAEVNKETGANPRSSPEHMSREDVISALEALRASDPQLDARLRRAKLKSAARLHSVTSRAEQTKEYAKTINVHHDKIEKTHRNIGIFLKEEEKFGLVDFDKCLDQLGGELENKLEGNRSWAGLTAANRTEIDRSLRQLLHDFEKSTSSIDSMLRTNTEDGGKSEVNNLIGEIKAHHKTVKEHVMALHAELSRFQGVATPWLEKLKGIGTLLENLTTAVEKYLAAEKSYAESDATLGFADESSESATVELDRKALIEATSRLQHFIVLVTKDATNLIREEQKVITKLRRDISRERRYKQYLDRLGKQQVCRFSDSDKEKLDAQLEQLRIKLTKDIGDSVEAIKTKYHDEIKRQTGCSTIGDFDGYKCLQTEIGTILRDDAALQAELQNDKAELNDLGKELETEKKKVVETVVEVAEDPMVPVNEAITESLKRRESVGTTNDPIDPKALAAVQAIVDKIQTASDLMDHVKSTANDFRGGAVLKREEAVAICNRFAYFKARKIPLNPSKVGNLEDYQERKINEIKAIYKKSRGVDPTDTELRRFLRDFNARRSNLIETFSKGGNSIVKCLQRKKNLQKTLARLDRTMKKPNRNKVWGKKISKQKISTIDW